MSIRPMTLERSGRKCLVIMDSHDTLDEALQQLGNLGYSENDAYLIVDRGDRQYQVIPFLDLALIASRLGYYAFVLPVRALPIPLADRVVPVDTPESGAEIVRWVNETPRSSVVVVESGQVVGLFANRHLSGSDSVFQPAPLLELHGQLARLHDDPRAAFEAQVSPPVCPHCGSQGFYQYDPQLQVYACTACKQEVELR